jgi:hypothetical protein
LTIVLVQSQGRTSQGDIIAAALDRLHAGGWSVGDTAFSEPGGTFHLVVNKEELSGWDMCVGRRFVLLRDSADVL